MHFKNKNGIWGQVPVLVFPSHFFFVNLRILYSWAYVKRDVWEVGRGLGPGVAVAL